MFENVTLYDWVPFFKEVSQKVAALAPAPDRDAQLMQMAKDCFPESTPIFQYNHIDPFSFIYTLAWCNTVNRRQGIFGRVKEALALSVNVPSDWNFPTPQPNAAVLFHFGAAGYFDRENNSVTTEALWDCFVQAVAGPNIDEAVFAAVLNLKGVRITKLSQTLSLINPVDFLSLGSNFPAFPPPANTNFLELEASGFVGYKTFLDKMSEQFPGCKMYEVNLLGLLLSKNKWFPISDSFWQVSSWVAGQENTDEIDSFVAKNAVWTGGSGDHKSRGGEYPLPDVQNGDIVLVRQGTKRFYGIGIALHNGHSQGFDDDAVIKILWIAKHARKSPDAMGDQTGFNYATDKTYGLFEAMYPETFTFLDAAITATTPKPKAVQNDTMPTTALNTILYGPPGTGKTYNSIEEAVRIVAPEFFAELDADQKIRRAQLKEKFDALATAGQIEFITFHQSMGYEDFIEGIKPVSPDEEEEAEGKTGLRYEVKDGLFKQLCTEAAYAYAEDAPSSEAGHVLEFSDAYDQLLARASEAIDAGTPLELQTRSGSSITVAEVSRNSNFSVRHGAGESQAAGGRLYIVSKNRLQKLAQAFPDLDAVVNIYDQFRSVIGGSNATAYYAVLQEIREQKETVAPISEKRARTYEEKQAAVKELTQADYKKDATKRFVLIIDEINRGNVSSIFGELITLLEGDKRLGRDEALRAKLPYSGERFGVPPNLYVIGTMNTADRSVEALDTALRRRFSFVHKGPDAEVLQTTRDGIDLKQLLRKLNRRLTLLIDADHTIGHAWLMNIETVEDLKSAFKNRILPLLQEYFYNDYAKLGLVLGKDFVKPAPDSEEDEMASFELADFDGGSYSDKVILELVNVEKLSRDHFIRIYNPKHLANAES